MGFVGGQICTIERNGGENVCMFKVPVLYKMEEKLGCAGIYLKISQRDFIFIRF